MTCKGIRPDGNQCDALDEYVSHETGLCWACAGPGSTALVPVGETALVAADPTLPTFDENLPWQCVEWLQAFIATRYIGKAAAIVGVDRGTHRDWKKSVPGFEEAFEIALQDVRDQEFDLLGQDNEPGGGLKEVMYDGDGGIKYTRFRQSEGLRKMRLMALDPDRYNPERSNDQNVTIILQSRNEGGWGDEEDQQPREILRSEGGKVTRPDGKGGWSSTPPPPAKAKKLDDIPETEVIESVDTGEGTSVSNEAPVEEHARWGGGETWRQRQFRAQMFSELPDDE